MNEYQKEKIKELRLKGTGYKAIAKALGLSRDSVRGFCRRNNLVGNKAVVALNMEVKLQKNEICSYCKKPIKQKNKGRTCKFCSSECRYKWWNENTDKRNRSEKAIYKYTCIYCSKKFIAYGDKSRKYCSHNCYIKDRFWGEEDGV